MKKGRIIFIILSVAWMIAVFCFSNQPSDTSKDTSLGVTNKIVTIIYGNSLSEEELNLKIEEWDPIVRKLAHYTLYTIGGILICLSINTFTDSTKRKMLITQLIGSMYAITDEFHQYFIPGRSSKITDVLIDSAGVFTGIILTLILLNILGRIHKKILTKE